MDAIKGAPAAATAVVSLFKREKASATNSALNATTFSIVTRFSGVSFSSFIGLC